MKKYILIAGVNGAGKSTLYRTLSELQEMPRVNTDEILKQFGDWRNTSDILTAGKIAVKKISQYFSEECTFNQETTLCGKSIIRNIKLAKEKGYFIELHYVGIDSVELAKKRVQSRIIKGGHGIPDKVIEKRYIETFQNLNLILPICDLAIFYDNTIAFQRFAIYRNGIAVRISDNIPEWFKKNIINTLHS